MIGKSIPAASPLCTVLVFGILNDKEKIEDNSQGALFVFYLHGLFKWAFIERHLMVKYLSKT